MWFFRSVGSLIVAVVFMLPSIASADPEREVPEYGGTVNIVTQHASLRCFP